MQHLLLSSSPHLVISIRVVLPQRRQTQDERQDQGAAQVGVFGLVDHTHPDTAQLLDNPIVRDGLADHWPVILGVRSQQVNETGSL